VEAWQTSSYLRRLNSPNLSRSLCEGAEIEITHHFNGVHRHGFKRRRPKPRDNGPLRQIRAAPFHHPRK
jgi:hypothetical protein